MKKDWVRSMTYEAIVILGVIALLTFICRLWPLLLLVMLCLIGAAIRLLFLKVKDATVQQEPEVVSVPEPKPVTERDVKDLAFSVILTRITELVEADYPKAKWVWEKPNAKALVLAGDEAYIILSGAGGYRRARPVVENLQLKSLDYMTVSQKPKEIEEDLPEDLDEEDDDAEIPVNYELMAFEWAEANVIELNERCNNAVGEGKEEMLISADELPVPESWESICIELNRAGLENLEIVPEGIKIKFMH